jgi:alpha-1,3-rhamnosyl/mannosyltransferase
VSAFTAEEIVSQFHFPADRIHLAPPGVAPHFWRDSPPPTERLADFGLVSQGYYLCVGTFEPRKNLATLVAAYSRLPPEIRDRIPLVLAGAPGWGDYGRSALWDRLMAKGQLRLLGYVPDSRLPELYGGAIALCMPSLYEGFGMPVAEALAGGTPALVSNAGALPATAGPGGITLPPLDVEAWTEAMAAMAQDGALRSRLAEHGRSHGRSFRWDQSAAVVAAALVAAGAKD